MIGINSALTNNTATVDVVTNFESIGYMVHNTVLILLVLLVDAGWGRNGLLAL